MREFPLRSVYGLKIGPIASDAGSLYAAVAMLRRAEALLNRAVTDVGNGDIVDAALKTIEARTQAGAAAGIARVSREVSVALIDILT